MAIFSSRFVIMWFFRLFLRVRSRTIFLMSTFFFSLFFMLVILFHTSLIPLFVDVFDFSYIFDFFRFCLRMSFLLIFFFCKFSVVFSHLIHNYRIFWFFLLHLFFDFSHFYRFFSFFLYFRLIFLMFVISFDFHCTYRFYISFHPTFLTYFFFSIFLAPFAFFLILCLSFSCVFLLIFLMFLVSFLLFLIDFYAIILSFICEISWRPSLVSLNFFICILFYFSLFVHRSSRSIYVPEFLWLCSQFTSRASFQKICFTSSRLLRVLDFIRDQ